MVYMYFPGALTEEEIMLQNKYKKLKKKKNALHQLKAPKQEPEKSPAKRPTEAKEAKEVAKKLLKSGAISAIKIENRGNQGFKRSQNLERKLSSSDRHTSGISGYQPFSQAHHSDDDSTFKRLGDDSSSSSNTKPYFQRFVKGSDDSGEAGSESSPMESRFDGGFRPRSREYSREIPKEGNTIFVYGFNLNQEMLEQSFKGFGKMVNLTCDMEKNRGFITFEEMKSAERAIKEMHKSVVSGVPLKVTYARRQPIIGTDKDGPSTKSWSAIAKSESEKGTHTDQRSLIAYDENLF